MARVQTMVQLTAALVDGLDVEAGRRGVSRSSLIRTVLGEFLDGIRADEVGERIAAAYRDEPPARPDAWGDLASSGVVGVRELNQCLDVEERRDGRRPW